jgi:uncharacterized protein
VVKDTLAQTRLICANVFTQVLDSDDAPTPMPTFSRVLTTLHAQGLGLWEATPGRFGEVEEDEVFLILSGSGTLTFQDSSTIELEPGVLVRLQEGDGTVWEVHSRLRQLYLS